MRGSQLDPDPLTLECDVVLDIIYDHAGRIRPTGTVETILVYYKLYVCLELVWDDLGLLMVWLVETDPTMLDEAIRLTEWVKAGIIYDNKNKQTR